MELCWLISGVSMVVCSWVLYNVLELDGAKGNELQRNENLGERRHMSESGVYVSYCFLIMMGFT